MTQSNRLSDREIHELALQRMAKHPFGEPSPRRMDFPTFVIDNETPREHLRSLFVSSLRDAHLSEEFLLKCTRRMLPLAQDSLLEASLLNVEENALKRYAGLSEILAKLHLGSNMHRRANPHLAMWDHEAACVHKETLDFEIYRCQQMTLSYQLGLYNVIFGFSSALNMSDEVAKHFQKYARDIQSTQEGLVATMIARPRREHEYW